MYCTSELATCNEQDYKVVSKKGGGAMNHKGKEQTLREALARPIRVSANYSKADEHTSFQIRLPAALGRKLSGTSFKVELQENGVFLRTIAKKDQK